MHSLKKKIRLLDDFSKFLFYENQVSYEASLCVEFHDCPPNSLRGEKSQRNHRRGSITEKITLPAQ